MAVYRNISPDFWDDVKVLEKFTPEDKYFYLYLLTNKATNLIGCYEISVNKAAYDTGYNQDTIRHLITRMEKTHKVIKYNETNMEVLILNWNKYNWHKSPKLDKAIVKFLDNVKTNEFKAYLADIYNKRDTVSIPYLYTMDTTVSVSVSDTVTDREIVKRDSKGKIPYQEIIDYFNSITNKRIKVTDKVKTLINARYAEGFNVDDFKTVIDKKYDEWHDDEKMSVYIRPSTLFGTKFQDYLNQEIAKPKINKNGSNAKYVAPMPEYSKDTSIDEDEEEIRERIKKMLEEGN